MTIGVAIPRAVMPTEEEPLAGVPPEPKPPETLRKDASLGAEMVSLVRYMAQTSS
jgi:hypothetical protein